MESKGNLVPSVKLWRQSALLPWQWDLCPWIPSCKMAILLVESVPQIGWAVSGLAQVLLRSFFFSCKSVYLLRGGERLVEREMKTENLFYAKKIFFSSMSCLARRSVFLKPQPKAKKGKKFSSPVAHIQRTMQISSSP